VLVLRAKACDAHGRIEIEPGIPATTDELREASSLSEALFKRALSVLLRWGDSSPTGWLGRMPDGCYVVRNLDRRQVSADAERKRRLRGFGATSPGTSRATSPGTSPQDEEEEEEEKEPHGVGSSPARETREATTEPVSKPGRKSLKPDPRKRIRLVEDEVTGIAHFEGITEEDRAEWQALAPSADLDRELAVVLSRRGTHEDWFGKRRRGGHWVDTLKAWMVLAQTFAERDRVSGKLGAVPARRNTRIVTSPTQPPLSSPPDTPLTLPALPWTQVVDRLSDRINGQTEQWIRPLRYVGDRGDVCVLEAPDEFHARWVRDNLTDEVKDALRDVVGRIVGVCVVFAGEAS
jgi:hypothetical protein